MPDSGSGVRASRSVGDHSMECGGGRLAARVRIRRVPEGVSSFEHGQEVREGIPQKDVKKTTFEAAICMKKKEMMANCPDENRAIVPGRTGSE